MVAAVIVTVLGGIYILIGTFFIWLNSAEIYKSRNNFTDRFWYALRCASTWPWVKVDK